MAKKEKKQPRPRAENPRGLEDRFGHQIEARRRMLDAIAGVYYRYGFDPLETPAIEFVEALGKFLPDLDRPEGGVFAFQDDDERWIALRYDMTAPLARVAAQHRLSLPTPYRRYAMGPVWRNEKPGPGRFREFWQCDADTVGTGGPAADAEICAMLADALEAAGIERGDYVIRVNNRKILSGVMEIIGLGDMSDPAQEDRRGHILRSMDKLDKFGPEGVRLLLGPGRKDASGAFTEGAGLSADQIDLVIAFTQSTGADGAATCANLRSLVEDSEVGQEGVEELETIAQLLERQGYGAGQIGLDPSIVRGLGYYTGPVFEAELTFDIIDEKGRKRQFGSVAGGGRYDDLVRRFTGQTMPATGVSIGVDRLLAALQATGRVRSEGTGPVVILALDKSRMSDYFSMSRVLRDAGIRAEVFMGSGTNMGKQLKYADKRNAPLAVIAGGNEFGQGVLQLKDLVLGAKLSEEISSNEEWKSQPAQKEIPADTLLNEVQAMLARHQ